MVNLFFELDLLRHALQDKGVDNVTVNNVIVKAKDEINALIEEHGQRALENAVEIGAEKKSAEFINQLRFDTLHFEVDTETRKLDFSEPPRPMLPHLLRNAKMNKDGSGFYKVIPVGKPHDAPKFSTSIVDAQRKIIAARVEEAHARRKAIAPVESKIGFRTASSKQDAAHQWVSPAKDKNFTEDIRAINTQLRDTLEIEIRRVIQSYLEMF